MATKTPNPATAETLRAGAAYIEALFREHRGPLLRYINGLLPNSEDAAEVLQETYVRLLRQHSLERVDANAKAWLFQVATNLVRDYFRQRKAHRADQHTPLDRHPADDPELQESEESVRWDDVLGRFKSTLLTLKPEVRAVFLLHRFRDLTYPQIARQLGISLRTVERHMNEAVSQLKRALESEV
jgi:RNA polymerase sigma-70 factor (ECF subfamily)